MKFEEALKNDYLLKFFKKPKKNKLIFENEFTAWTSIFNSMKYLY